MNERATILCRSGDRMPGCRFEFRATCGATFVSRQALMNPRVS